MEQLQLLTPPFPWISIDSLCQESFCVPALSCVLPGAGEQAAVIHNYPGGEFPSGIPKARLIFLGGRGQIQALLKEKTRAVNNQSLGSFNPLREKNKPRALAVPAVLGLGCGAPDSF